MSLEKGVYQLKDGHWGYRFVIKCNGKAIDRKRTLDEFGQPFKTKQQAIRARLLAIEKERNGLSNEPSSPLQIERKTYKEVFEEYREKGRLDKAYGTIRKQDSLWENHIRDRYGGRFVDEVSVAEINDYLAQLYYQEGRSYSYVESFLKMFYLILGQAYSRNYMSQEVYAKLCLDKQARIKMPKKRLTEEEDTITFSNEEIEKLDAYFKGTNAETAYLLGKYCGLRVSECYGLMWKDIDFETRTISIVRQMQYIEGLISLVQPKTRNAKRTLFMADPLLEYLRDLRSETAAYSDQQKRVREQKATMLPDELGEMTSSLALVNTLPNGKIQTVNSMKFHTRKIKESLGIDFKYHYLRHTYGTRLAELNTPIFLLCNQMGHASSKVTERYYIGMTKRGEELLISNLNQI